MNEVYHHIVVQGKVVLSNLPDELKGEIDNATAQTQYIICPIKNVNKRQKKQPLAGNEGYMYLCSYDATLTKKDFNRLFTTYQAISTSYVSIISDMERDALKEAQSLINRLEHNILGYIADITDEVESVLMLEESNEKNWRDLVNQVQEKVEDNPYGTSLALLKTSKYIKLIDAELYVYDLMVREAWTVKRFPSPIHKVVTLSLQPYLFDFFEKRIFVHLGECRENLRIDFKSVTVLLGHLWNNAIKYCASSNNLTINFISTKTHVDIEIEQFSLCIKPEEKELVFKPGYSGYWAKENAINGKGLGLYYVQKLAELNDGAFWIEAGENITNYNGMPYARNLFVVRLMK